MLPLVHLSRMRPGTGSWAAEELWASG